ncbi:MAG TPA: beta-propeller domain-containing protein [Actinophytocola sp.]|uniref:beta-propeller domain-containing protein n=1 Tax=Actinophytocola sp. TaxID=1872138 RepID=UPI002DBAAEC7|nr:beta-propeller domain-containing protein [Actinophytocola sp.]HEU5475204.1 beta-propeller domain-containing protein [Actinophytocola sp.]
MKRDLSLGLRIGAPVVAVGALVSGLVLWGSAGPGENGTTGDHAIVGAEGISLVAFDDCDAALGELRRRVLPLVGPYGLGGGGMAVEDGAGAAPPQAPAAGPAAPRPAEGRAAAEPGFAEDSQKKEQEHSTTNTHEAGVDEPDLVKTDGRRLITIADGRLRVVDVASRAVTVLLDLPGGPATQLLISGDRALVLVGPAGDTVPGRGKPAPGGGTRSELVLVDLTGTGKVLGTLAVEGGYLDARQVGSVARVVLRSEPRLEFVYPDGARSEREALRRNRDIVENAPIEDWLPRYDLDSGGKRESGTLVECAAVSHPASFSGTAMLTVLTIDLAGQLGTGDPVSIVADGDTVYGTGSNLYVADDHQTRVSFGGVLPRPSFAPSGEQRTEVYQFDISGPGRPVYVASGGVNGLLLNQYSLSEHAGHLRIATTTGEDTGRTESMVTVLARRGDELVPVGRVGGLGVGERIYSVRFIGPVGYVVTFRQTDPLYTVDLSDPARPRVTGELKITGYSAYLHAAGAGRLLGVGQEATETGRRLGTQVSLFDTANLSSARRLAQYQLPGGTSEVEFDPHAFLYWPEKGLVVLPVINVRDRTEKAGMGGALVLRLAGDAFTELGMITHPVEPGRYPDPGVRRALVIGDELWTVSGSGVLVSDLDRLAQRAWIPFR